MQAGIQARPVSFARWFRGPPVNPRIHSVAVDSTHDRLQPDANVS